MHRQFLYQNKNKIEKQFNLDVIFHWYDIIHHEHLTQNKKLFKFTITFIIIKLHFFNYIHLITLQLREKSH